MFTALRYYGEVCICIIVGRKSLHNFNRITSQVCCENWKELPNIIEGAEEGKMNNST